MLAKELDTRLWKWNGVSRGADTWGLLSAAGRLQPMSARRAGVFLLRARPAGGCSGCGPHVHACRRPPPSRNERPTGAIACRWIERGLKDECNFAFVEKQRSSTRALLRRSQTDSISKVAKRNNLCCGGGKSKTQPSWSKDE
jgi:hypothetical protein